MYYPQNSYIITCFGGNCLWPRPDNILQCFFLFAFQLTHVVGESATKTINTTLAIRGN